MHLVSRSFANLDGLLPKPKKDGLEELTDEIILRTGATRIRQVAKALHASIETKRGTAGGLQALCLPIRYGYRMERGLRFHIVVYPERAKDYQDVDPWVFLVGHEIGHIVSDTFSGMSSRFTNPGAYTRTEDWCSDFGRSLGRKLTTSRR